MTAIKVCGITSKEQLLWLNQLPIDYLGFVFAPGSKRWVSASQVKQMLTEAPPKAKTVGVFLGLSLEEIEKIMQKTGLDIAQLHGEEALFSQSNELPYPTVRRVHPKDWCQHKTKAWSNHYAWILDPGAGDGKSFDWQFLQDEDLSCIWLAGGLDASNVGQLVRRLNPALVDVSTGVEVLAGQKCEQKVKAFINQVLSL